MDRRELSPESRAAFIAAMRDVVTSHLPDWTDPNVHDPGVTLLELLAYAVEETAFRTDVPARRTDAAIARLLHAVSRLERHGAPPVRVSVDGEPWRPVPSLDEARPGDRVFAVDADGVVAFGDGVHGAKPPAGSEVSVRFAAGGGREGNSAVTVSATWPFTDAAVAVTLRREGSALIVRRS